MDNIIDIPDSTDWLSTPLHDFAQFENALHCQICKEFYDTPMITSCSHTFCSKCIRTSLSADGLCPACRTADQASKLRNNWVLQEVVSAFLQARPAGIQFARKAKEEAEEKARPSAKRKRGDDVPGIEPEGRMTRRKSRRLAESTQSSQAEPIEIYDNDGDDDFVPEKVDDGLVECPLGCGKRMSIEAVEPHLDKCEDEKQEAQRAKARMTNGRSSNFLMSPTSKRTEKPAERLSELNYSMMKEAALSKRLRDLGIPSTGGKQLMIKRHTEWVNIWNANCDSSHPRSKPELLRDLDSWERTQGGKAPVVNGLASTIMRKDFDTIGWSSRNKDDFSRLIADAKKKRMSPAQNDTKEESGTARESEPALKTTVSEEADRSSSTEVPVVVSEELESAASDAQMNEDSGQSVTTLSTASHHLQLTSQPLHDATQEHREDGVPFSSQNPIRDGNSEVVRSPYTFSAVPPSSQQHVSAQSAT